jgi:hypothetical protein
LKMHVAFTIDVDADVAWACEGKTCAVTKGKDEALFEASESGFVSLQALLEENGWPATLFFEARAAEAMNAGDKDLKNFEIACHGLAHEDFTGKDTGLKMKRGDKAAVLAEAKRKLEDVFPRHSISGFRAPYLHWDKELLELLLETGFLYDSSVTVAREREVDSPLPEVPLLEFEVAGKKKSSYLWQLMEGKYSVEEYLPFVAKALEENALVVLATHSWHLSRSVAKGELSDAQAKANEEKVRKVLNFAEESGAMFTSISDFLGVSLD